MGQLNKLTDTQIKNYKLAEGVKEIDLPDGGNLVLRVKPSGKTTSKSWRFPFTLKGERDFIYIGEYPAITLDSARDLAKDYREQLKRKENPKAMLEATAAVEHAEALAAKHGETPTTFGELFYRWEKDYLAHHHEDRGAYMRGIFERHILVDGMAELRLDLMRQAHIKTVLEIIQRKNVPAIVERALHSIRQLVVWAAGFGWMERDPTLGLKAKTFGGKTQEGDRALSEEEVTQLHWRLKKSHLVNRWKEGCWLIAATSTRVEETILAKRTHINLARGTWTIPPENQKKTNTGKPRKPHVIHLSNFARKRIEALLAMPGTEHWLFPAVVRGREADSHADHKTMTHALSNLQGADHKGRRSTTELLLECGPFGPHDLRRTGSTLLQDMGFDQGVIDRCQNHVEPNKIRRTYQVSELRRLKAEAWDALGQKLEELTSLPDPEPDYVAPVPKYVVTDLTDPEAVAKRAAEEAATNARRAERKPRKPRVVAPAAAPSPIEEPFDFQDDI